MEEKPERSGVPPKSTQRRPVAAAIAWGAIVWLPARRFIKPKRYPHIPAEVFDHPVLIYNVPQPGKADAFLVSTYNGTKVLEAARD